MKHLLVKLKIFSFQKEAENVLSKRLAEVNDELNKSQARNSSLQNDLNDTKQLLKTEEVKSTQLSEQVKGLTAADSLTAKLQEATSRVSELEDVLTGFEHQLKVSQEVQLQKDKEIQVSMFSSEVYQPLNNLLYILFLPYNITTKSKMNITIMKVVIL